MDSSSQSTTLPSMHPLTLKLDRTNYNFWKVQVLATARAYGFEDVLLQTESPPQFLEATSATPTANPRYLTWLKRDQFLFSWILASIAPPMMSYIGRCTTAAQIWKAFESFFHSQSKARAMQLRNQLQMMKKGDSSIDDYILRFREISDQLFNIGQEIADSDLISYILQGLGAEYESISVVLSSKCDELTLHDVQFALQTHELRLQHQAASHSVHIPFSPQANAAYHQQFPSHFGDQRGRGGRSGRGYGNQGGRGGGGRSNSGNRPVCQLCGKQNHVALKCYRRFDVSFTGPEAIPHTSPPPPHSSQSPTANFVNYSVQADSDSQVL